MFQFNNATLGLECAENKRRPRLWVDRRLKIQALPEVLNEKNEKNCGKKNLRNMSKRIFQFNTSHKTQHRAY